MTDLIYARADLPAAILEPTDAPVMSLKEALATAEPGTLIQLLPGRFTKKTILKGKHGEDGAAIIIRGSLDEVTVDGLVDPLSIPESQRTAWWTDALAGRDLRKLRGNQRPMFRLERCSWIEFRNLRVVQCWPTFLHIRSCHHVTVAECQVVGGKDAIFIDDRKRRWRRGRPSHHILVERNAWRQDPTGSADPLSDDPSDSKLWQEWVWHQFKKKPHKGPWAGDPRWEDVRFMNGGFVVGEHMAGTIIVRRNQMRFAFNAVMLMVEEDQDLREPLKPGDLGDAPAIIGDPSEFKFNYTPPDLSRNTNVEVYSNTIEYIRDNAVEPEYGATNWWVWNNRVRNVHKAWSIHNNGGGFWYFFGNLCAHDEIPPAQVKEPVEWQFDNKGNPTGIRKLGGSIFKLLFGPPMPEKPCFAFHNSARPRGGVVNHGEMRKFTHVNNAIEHCAPAEPVDLMCGTPVFAQTFEDGRVFDYKFATRIAPVTADAVNRFDNDVSTGVDFPDQPRGQDQENNGIGATDIFDPAKRADYVLTAGSPARGAAAALILRGGIDWPAQEDWHSSAPDAGAVQPDGHFRGPVFAHHANKHYSEAARLVGIECGAGTVELIFSVPLAHVVPPGVSSITLKSGDEIGANSMTIQGRRILLDFGRDVATDDISAVHLPNGLTGNDDGRLLPLTTWASIIPLFIE